MSQPQEPPALPDILTSSGSPVSRIGLGASPGIDAGCVQAAFEGGISYFFCYDDTFPGMIEGLRSLLRKAPEQVVVASGSEARETKAFRRDFDRLRKRLGVDRINVFQAEYVSPSDDLDRVFGPNGVLSDRARLRDAGLIRYAAASVHDRKLGVELIGSGAIDILMIRYNMAHRGAETRVLPAAIAAGVPVVSFTNTRWGSLLVPPAGWRPGRPVPTAADCYRFVLRHPAVRVALTAPGTVEKLNENLSGLRDGFEISPERFGTWEEFGRLVYGDGKADFETRWP